VSRLDIFAWVVLAVLLIAGLVIWFVLAMLPGRIARKRNHPQADAINVAGWLGALFAGIFWPLALIWAFYKPDPQQVEIAADISKAVEADLKAKADSKANTDGKATTSGNAEAG
jgi:hypothetical protein